MSNFQWVWRYSCLKLACTVQIFVCEDGWKAKSTKKKVNTRDEWVARITNSAALIKKERQDDLRRAAPTPSGLKIVLKSMVGFFNTYFELLLFIEFIYITNKYNQYVICLCFIHFGKLLCVAFKQLYLHTHWKLDTCLCELIYSE